MEYRNEERIAVRDKFGIRFLINFDQSTISNGGTRTDEREMTALANSIKRTYSTVVIDEVAKKAKWLKRDLGQNDYQLQRY